MIYLNLPDFTDGMRIYEYIIKFRRDYPEVFYENTEIATIFGNFSGAIWNGGGLNLIKLWSRNEVQDLIGYYNEELKIPLRFTFTNPLIEEKHCYDSYCNMIAECAHNGINEVLTSSNYLEDYLRKNYPKFKFCHSIIATGDNPCDLSDRYHISVMRRRMNNNWEYLDTIPMEKRGKIEFLCTDPCPDNCPRIYTHYRDFARAQIEYNPEACNLGCSMEKEKGAFHYNHLYSLDTYISRDMIEKEYLPRGFTQFKISGRGNIGAQIFHVCDYMVKPEFKRDVMAALFDLFL